MKVVVVGTRGIPGIMGGVETHCEQLYPLLAEMGYDVTVVRRRPYVRDGLTEWHGVHLHDISCPRRRTLEAIVHTFRAVAYAHRVGADVVHIHCVGPALATWWARLLGMRVVMTHHGPDYERAKWGPMARMMLRLGERIAAARADRIIVISEPIWRLLAVRCHRQEGVSLIPNGVPLAEMVDYPDYFARLGITEGRYILGACRFVKEKNLHHLIEAFTMVRREWEEARVMGDGRETFPFRLVLAGDADHEDAYSLALKEAARRAGVVLTGVVKGRRLASLLTHTCCYCLPSSQEGLPIGLLEAMSYGVQVAVSDIPAMREVHLPEACYFPCGDVAALAARLKAVMSRPPQYTKYDLSAYDWRRIATQVADVYDSLA